MIVKQGSQYVLKFSDGREEKFSSEEAAKKREKQVNYFKFLDAVKKKHEGK
jgi:hypothetical protein